MSGSGSLGSSRGGGLGAFSARRPCEGPGVGSVDARLCVAWFWIPDGPGVGSQVFGAGQSWSQVSSLLVLDCTRWLLVVFVRVNENQGPEDDQS